MEFSPGDRVELVATGDPYTRLRPGDRGTVTSVTDRPVPTIEVQWDTGSTLAVLADAGDRIRQLPTGDLRPVACPPAAVSRPSPPDRQAGQAANRPDGRPGGATPTQPGRHALTP